MTVLVLGHFTVNPANVERMWVERRDDLVALGETAKQMGAIHHRWGISAIGVVSVDEWRDVESFNTFFRTQTLIAEIMEAIGVQGPPQFEILEARSAPDEF